MLECVTIDGLLRDKGARALLGVEDAADFHFPIGAHDGVGVDLEVYGNLTDGGELIARNQKAGSNGSLYLVDELAVEGYAALYVEAEGEGTPDWKRNLHADE
jgi:hypothetical protein